MLTPDSSSQSRITSNDRLIVENVRVSLRRPPRGPGGPGVRTHTVTEAIGDVQPSDPLEHDFHGDHPSHATTT